MHVNRSRALIAKRMIRPGQWLQLLLLSLVAYVPAQAQYDAPENQVWIFGIFAGLDFNSGQPVPIRSEVSGVPLSNMANGMASAAVCDRNGRLLFYTNGCHVWNRTHNLMQATALHPWAYNLTPVTQVTTQGTVIVQMPGDPYKYYIFSLTNPGTHAPVSVGLYGKLYYSVVDMQANSGLGEVVAAQQWQFMGEDLSDKMMAIPGDRCNVWLLVHAIDTNRFLAYEITAAGINLTPVESFTGSARTIPAPGGRNYYWSDGQMAISTDYRKLAINSTFGSCTEVFDFDISTGRVSNAVMIDTGFAAYGLAFSAGNSKLYSVESDPQFPSRWNLQQYDLLAGSTAAITLSKTKINTDFLPKTQLRLGPDNRIYFGNNKNNQGHPVERGPLLGAVLAPELAAPACRYQPRTVELLQNTNMVYGLGHVAIGAPDSLFSLTYVNLCLDSEQVTAPSGYDSYVWNDGVTGQTRQITAAGTYWVTGRKSCVVHVDSFRARYVLSLSLGDDTAVCRDPKPITLRPDVQVQVSAYLWSDGSSNRTLVARRSGKYWVRITANGCVASDTVEVTITNLAPDLGGDTVYCDPSVAPVVLAVDVPPLASARWSNGDTGMSVAISEPGVYWVELKEGGCTVSDTMRADFLQFRQDLGPDTVFCRERPIVWPLSARIPEGGSVLWADGSTGREVIVRDTGTFWVEVRYLHCVQQDSAHISSEFCNCRVSMPTAFSPNGDGRNDLFRAVIGPECLVSDMQLVIFNRWGELVYQGDSPAAAWDGYFKGAPAEIGTYMYRIVATVGTEKHVQEFTGDLVLVR